MGGVWKRGSLGNGACVGVTVFSPPQSGEIEIVNHKTGDKCILKFVPYSYFSRDVARKVGTRIRGTPQAARDCGVS